MLRLQCQCMSGLLGESVWRDRLAVLGKHCACPTLAATPPHFLYLAILIADVVVLHPLHLYAQVVSRNAAVVPWKLLDELDAARTELEKAKHSVEASPWNASNEAASSASGRLSGDAASQASALAPHQHALAPTATKPSRRK